MRVRVCLSIYLSVCLSVYIWIDPGSAACNPDLTEPVSPNFHRAQYYPEPYTLHAKGGQNELQIALNGALAGAYWEWGGVWLEVVLGSI